MAWVMVSDEMVGKGAMAPNVPALLIKLIEVTWAGSMAASQAAKLCATGAGSARLADHCSSATPARSASSAKGREVVLEMHSKRFAGFNN